MIPLLPAFRRNSSGRALINTITESIATEGLTASAEKRSPRTRENRARVIPHPGQGRDVMYSKGQGTDRYAARVSAENMPVRWRDHAPVKITTHQRANFRGRR